MSDLSILFVDDDDDIRHIVRLSLSLDPAISLFVAKSGHEALAALNDGFHPDVALLDVMMPGMTGPELLARLRDRPGTERLPVIFMTAKGRQADVEDYLRQGAVSAIIKPFDPLSLAAQIRSILAASGGGTGIAAEA